MINLAELYRSADPQVWPGRYVVLGVDGVRLCSDIMDFCSSTKRTKTEVNIQINDVFLRRSGGVLSIVPCFLRTFLAT